MNQYSAAWKFKTQKSNDNIYFEFEDKFRALSKIQFIHTIYHFESREVRSPRFQMVYKSKLK